MAWLDDPIPLRCGATLPGRTWLAPMTNTQSHEDGTLSDDELRWLEARAAGGFHVVETCAASVHDEGRAWPGQLGVSHERHLDGLGRMATALKQHGAFAVVQLHHGGNKAERAVDPISADDGDGFRAATEAELVEAIEAFADAARRAETAGFDGVEIHGANGYLLTQFMAPEDNHRTDGWGGTLQGRMRLTLEVLEAVRAAVSPGFAVGIRISPVDTWNRRGLVLADGLELGRQIAARGADFVHLSLGDAAGPPPHEEDGPVVVTAFREALPADVPVVVAGGIVDRAGAERALAAGADAVAVARAAIAYPDWPRRAAASDWAPAPNPWSRELLRQAAVSDALFEYLGKFSGLVEGGKAAR